MILIVEDIENRKISLSKIHSVFLFTIQSPFVEDSVSVFRVPQLYTIHALLQNVTLSSIFELAHTIVLDRLVHENFRCSCEIGQSNLIFLNLLVYSANYSFIWLHF